MKRFNFSAIIYLLVACFLLACDEETAPVEISQEQEEIVVEPDLRYGFDFNQYTAKQLKIKRGDTFGAILERNGIDYPQVYEILQSISDHDCWDLLEELDNFY